MKKRVLIAVSLTAAIVAIAAAAWPRVSAPDPMPGFPRLVLWAWEMPERMTFIDPQTTAVAFLARTVRWHERRLEPLPRLQPLQVPPSTPLIAVVRLESDDRDPPDTMRVVNELRAVAALGGVRALQIDFDARASERPWYRAMLDELRKDIPQSTPLTITALASWCERDNWMGGIAVTDAVPMLFRMGAGEQFHGPDFGNPLCRASVGISTDELPDDIPHGRRLFVFSPTPWTEDTYRGAIRLYRRWQ
jgi:hypothetical protein